MRYTKEISWTLALWGFCLVASEPGSLVLIDVKSSKLKQISPDEVELEIPQPDPTTPSQKSIGHILNTRGNSANIAPRDMCGVFLLPEPTIICSSGKVIQDIGYATVALTGSKVARSYVNLIGSYISENPIAGHMGSGKRTFYCIGTCQEKK